MKKNNKTKIPTYSISLAIFDYVPVCLFGTAMIIVGIVMGARLFMIGATLSFAAGIIKASWKFIVAYKKKNFSWMNIVFRILMLIGFLLMVIGLFKGGDRITFSVLWEFVLRSPARWFLVTTGILMCLMGVWGVILDHKSEKANWIMQITNTLAQFSILIGVISLAYAGNYYHVSNSIVSAMEMGYDDIMVTTDDDMVVFSPTKEDDIHVGMIFYPGGKVQREAYAPLMIRCAKNGITCVLVHMPDNLAILDTNAADGIIERFPAVDKWYMAGHSLGAAAASMYIDEHIDEFAGLILLGAYSAKDISDTDLRVLSIYGSEDGILNRKKYEKNKTYLPEEFEELVIDGGCHAYFGCYGEQKGDGKAKINDVMQINITADAIIDFVN